MRKWVPGFTMHAVPVAYTYVAKSRAHSLPLSLPLCKIFVIRCTHVISCKGVHPVIEPLDMPLVSMSPLAELPTVYDAGYGCHYLSFINTSSCPPHGKSFFCLSHLSVSQLIMNRLLLTLLFPLVGL